MEICEGRIKVIYENIEYEFDVMGQAVGTIG